MNKCEHIFLVTQHSFPPTIFWSLNGSTTLSWSCFSDHMRQLANIPSLAYICPEHLLTSCSQQSFSFFLLHSQMCKSHQAVSMTDSWCQETSAFTQMLLLTSAIPVCIHRTLQTHSSELDHCFLLSSQQIKSFRKQRSITQGVFSIMTWNSKPTYVKIVQEITILTDYIFAWRVWKQLRSA